MPEKTLEKLCVKDICNLVVRDPATVGPDCSLDDLLAKVVKHKTTRHVYVIDENQCLVGSVRLKALMGRLFPYATLAQQGDVVIGSPHQMFDADCVRDFMHPDPRYVKEETLLKEMIQIMIEEDVTELPVVDSERHVIGEVNIIEAIAGYLKAKGIEQPE